jgi:hypothetical protein
MNTPHHDSETPWEKRLRQARADAGPPVDVAALLRTVRGAPLDLRVSWLDELSGLFGSPRFIPACLAAAAGCASVATWQLWEAWQMLSWAQLLAPVTGGIS